MYTVIKRAINKELIPLVSIVLGLFICTTLLHYAIIPTIKHSIILRDELSRYNMLIRGDEKYDKLKTEIREKQKELEKKHTELTQGLADPHDLSGLLQMIFDKAWKTGIRFDKTVPQKEIKGKDYIHYPVLLEMTTTYNQLGKFISSLENIPQIVQVNRVALIAKDDERILARVLITCFLGLQK